VSANQSHACRNAHDAKGFPQQTGEARRWAPTSGASRRKGAPGARSEASTSGRVPTQSRRGIKIRGIKENVIMGRLIPAGTGLPAYKRLQVVLDEKSPTYAPPTFVRVTPAELVAVGDE